MRLIRRSFAVAAIGVTAWTLLAGVALAAEDVPTPSGPSTGQSVLDNLPVVSLDAALLAAIVGLAIPLLTALLTKLNAAGWLQTLMSVVLAGLTGLAAWLANVTGVVDLWDALLVAILAGATAGGTRVAWTSTIEAKLNHATKNFGLGSSSAPAADPSYPGGGAQLPDGDVAVMGESGISSDGPPDIAVIGESGIRDTGR